MRERGFSLKKRKTAKEKTSVRGETGKKEKSMSGKRPWQTGLEQSLQTKQQGLLILGTKEKRSGPKCKKTKVTSEKGGVSLKNG